jgi:hypothetical protein
LIANDDNRYFSPEPAMNDFKSARIEAGYSLDDCVKVFDVSMKTIKRWESKTAQPPRAVFLCLSMFAGQLDFLGKPWHGFRILPDCIASPDKMHIWPGEIRAMKYLFQAIGIDRTQFNLSKSKAKPKNVYSPSTLPNNIKQTENA